MQAKCTTARAIGHLKQKKRKWAVVFIDIHECKKKNEIHEM